MDILSPTDINEHHVEKIVQGVETDADGMVIAYWVCDRHPLASTSVTGLTASHWTRVEAYGKKTGRQNVLCLMQRERAGQLRGVPLLAPVLESLKQLGRFTDAELTAAVISAMFTVFIFSPKGRIQNHQKGGDSPRHGYTHECRFLPESARA